MACSRSACAWGLALVLALVGALWGCEGDPPTGELPDAGVVDGAVAADAGSDAAGDAAVRADGEAPDAGVADAAPPAPDAALPTPRFTVVMLPDTQYYCSSSKRIVHFEAQTSWIAKNATQYNIPFVSHVGDIVDHGALSSAEWDRADKALGTLDGDLKAAPDGVVPYAAVPGNHDYDVVYVKGTPNMYIKYFGPKRYTGRSWFLGASPNKTSMAQLFKVAGKSFLHLGLEWKVSDASLLWAQQVIAAHPGVPVIVATHQYVNTGTPAKRATGGGAQNGGGDNSGEDLYRKLVEPFPEVLLVLCGHYHGDGWRADKSPLLGHDQLQVLADYQKDPNGGNGWMQLITVDAANKEIAFSAFSPTYKVGSTSGVNRAANSASNHKHTFDLGAHRASIAAGRVLRFREGLGPGGSLYKGTQDTYVGDGSSGTTKASSSYGNKGDVWIDGDSDREQGLLRFDGIVGSAKGQIPPGTTIKRAILTLTTEGSYADSASGAKLYRMKVAWTESVTYSSLGKGIQVGTHTEAKHEADSKGLVGSKGTRSLDVTASVQAWAAGAKNHGWAIINNGTDRWQFRSSEWATAAERPMLTVVY